MRARRERSSLPRVALAGYTNAGKSTLLNALTGAEVGVGDRLFHTLDPTTRSFELSGRDYLLTDTVGFIEKLPHQLVEAFKATLEETVLADLILHVVDAAAPEERRVADMQAVDEVLEEIGAGEKPRLLVLNKADLLDEDERREALLRHPDAVLVSALDGEGLDELRERIEAAFEDTLTEVELLIPYARGRRGCTSCTRSPATSSGPSARTASSSTPGCRSPSCTASTISPSSRVRPLDGAAGREAERGGACCPRARTRATPGSTSTPARPPTSGPGSAGASAPGSRSRSPTGTPGWCCRARAWPASTGSPWSTAPGLIDAGYRGEVRVLLLNTDPAETFRVEPGDRIAQLVIAPIALAEPVEVEALARVRPRRRRLRLQRPLAAADPEPERRPGSDPSCRRHRWR